MAALVETPALDLDAQLAARGVSRRRFLKYCATMAAVLAMPPAFAHTLVRGLQTAARVPVIWLEAQDCAGNSEALLRAEKPTVAEVILDTLSLDYHHLLMVSSGSRSDQALEAVRKQYPGGYIVVIEGSVPLADGGVYSTVGGRTFAEMARAVSSEALAVIAVGSCAWDGGIPAARGGLTGAVGVSQWLGGGGPKIINLPGCPMNPDNLTSLIVQYLATKRWPEVDTLGRPLFAYGDTVHEHCESLPHYRAKEFVRAWGDEGHRKGWCLYQMGCKGPSTNANCSTLKFNGGTSWPVSSGHGCVGCTTLRFWDTMSPFYRVGGAVAVASPTPVDYKTPVPNAKTPAPTSAPGSTTPAATVVPGATPDSGGDNTALYVALGAAGVAAAAGAGGVALMRARRETDTDSESPKDRGDEKDGDA